MEIFVYIIIIAIALLAGGASIGRKGPAGAYRKRKRQDQLDVEEIDKNIKRMDSMGVVSLLSPEELADENNYVSKFSENSYIQNNTKLISHEVSILTPSFNSDNFVKFAQDIFKKLVDEGKGPLGSLVDGSVDMSSVPDHIDRYDVCFLHNYIVESGYESIKVLITINEGTPNDKYFLLFKRQNPAIKVTKGEPVAINCPNCGGNISFAAKHMVTKCPYCNNMVTFAEYDWALTSVEHISGDTVITNRAVVKH